MKSIALGRVTIWGTTGGGSDIRGTAGHRVVTGGGGTGDVTEGADGGGRHGRGAPVADGRVTGSRNCKQVGRGGGRGGVPAGTSAIPIPNQPRFLNPQTFREQHRTINAIVDIPTLVHV